MTVTTETDLANAIKNEMQSMPLPVAPGEYAILHGAFPFTEEKWQQMLAVLQAMKPALVARTIAIPGGFKDVQMPTDQEMENYDPDEE